MTWSGLLGSQSGFFPLPEKTSLVSRDSRSAFSCCAYETNCPDFQGLNLIYSEADLGLGNGRSNFSGKICGGKLVNFGFVQSLDLIIKQFFSSQNGQCKNFRSPEVGFLSPNRTIELLSA